MWDHLWQNLNLVIHDETSYDILNDAALAIQDGKIAWLGSQSQLPQQSATQIHDGNNALVTPGLIDCHTHLVYAGNRANEFNMRLNGKTYAEIAQAGGGIKSTVTSVRAASLNDLVNESLPRAQALLKEGVTTIEIKSGYGLDLENEIKMLQAAKIISEKLFVNVEPTFLGAHALPPEFSDNADGYIDSVCNEMLPEIAKQKLCSAVDGFCEGIGFNPEQIERVFEAAKSHNLPVKLHAEQLTDLHGAGLAAKYNALSADHLEYISEADIKAMAQSGTTAVLLPGAFYFLKETQKPPIELFRKHNVPIAIATDCNPGSSPTCSLLLMMNMACTLFAMTPTEAFNAVTVNAASALGLQDKVGCLAVGRDADLAFWNCKAPEDLSYPFGFNPCVQVIKDGEVVWSQN